MSPRKTLEYCDIPICGEYGATLCHPARHGNTATFLYVVRMVLHNVTPQDMGILRHHSYMWYVWCYTVSPRKTWEYCDIPICGKDTPCHPARHGNTATFLFVVCMVLHNVTPRKTWEYCDITFWIPICGKDTPCHPARHGNTATFLYVVRIHHVTPARHGNIATFLYVV